MFACRANRAALRPKAGIAPKLVAFAALLLPPQAGAATFRAGNVVMGTVLQVSVVHEDAGRARELAEESVAVAKYWDDVLTTWRDDGELARLNANAGKGPVAVSDDLHRALADMIRLSAETGGAFDPAVGPLVRSLREKSSIPGSAAYAKASPPQALRIETALALSDGRAALREGAELDAGGIGKGVALDAIAEFLRDSDATAWYLDFGGSSQAAHRDADAGIRWVVAVAGLQTGTLRGTIDLTRGSLSTSRALPAGEAAGAIVDPRNGAPVTPPVLATVYAKDATTAEAWSTALIVLGPAGIAKAERAGVQAAVETADTIAKTANFPAISAIDGQAAPPSPAAK
jgi:thiamine biosynthesis lipoprotein